MGHWRKWKFCTQLFQKWKFLAFHFLQSIVFVCVSLRCSVTLCSMISSYLFNTWKTTMVLRHGLQKFQILCMEATLVLRLTPNHYLHLFAKDPSAETDGWKKTQCIILVRVLAAAQAMQNCVCERARARSFEKTKGRVRRRNFRLSRRAVKSVRGSSTF